MLTHRTGPWFSHHFVQAVHAQEAWQQAYAQAKEAERALHEVSERTGMVGLVERLTSISRPRGTDNGGNYLTVTTIFDRFGEALDAFDIWMGARQHLARCETNFVQHWEKLDADEAETLREFCYAAFGTYFLTPLP